jgi:hypothetical protein
MHEGVKVILGAARCALVLDAPLLFIPKRKSTRWPLYMGTIKRWRNATARGHKRPKLFRVTEGTVRRCMSKGRRANASGLSALKASRPFDIEIPEVRVAKELAPVVVFAAAKAAGDAPDIGVGLALAGHIATPRREVTLVVVPRYLQADPGLEDQLRQQRQTVERGVLLGQSGILSEDTHALLRQVIAARDTRGILGEARTDVDAAKAALAALLAVFGFGTAARTAPEAGRRLVETIPERIRGPVRRRYLMARARTGLDVSPTEYFWIDALDEHQKVTVWLRSGGRLSGFVEHQERRTGLLRLRDVTVMQNDNDEAETAAAVVLVPLHDVALVGAEVEVASTEPPSPIRRAGLRLVAEVVATLSGDSLPAIESSELLNAIAKLKDKKEHTIPDAEDAVWTDLPRVREDASAAGDVGLDSALYALEDSLRLTQRHSDSDVAWQNLLEALTALTDISSRRTAAGRTAP